jgi:hypothetical protein
MATSDSSAVSMERGINRPGQVTQLRTPPSSLSEFPVVQSSDGEMRASTGKDVQHRSINVVAEDWNQAGDDPPGRNTSNSQRPKEFPSGIPVAACTGSRFTRSAIRSNCKQVTIIGGLRAACPFGPCPEVERAVPSVGRLHHPTRLERLPDQAATANADGYS